jgi:hypothetical protein
LLGGAVLGGFAGILLGGVLGAVYGLWVGDVSLGLDGAILVGFCLVVAGAFYGVIVGSRPERETHRSSDQGSGAEDSVDRNSGSMRAVTH